MNTNQGEKWKLNAVAEKENTRWNNKSEKQSVLGKWKARQLIQKKFVGVQPFIAANKTKQNWKLKQLTLQEKCIVHEAIKI
jgi:hypothetical protein